MLGQEGIYLVLLLYYTLKSNVPTGIKVLICASIAYFICPVDAVPDWIPVAGYADDLAVLLYTKHKIGQYVNAEVCSKAETKLLELKEVIK